MSLSSATGRKAESLYLFSNRFAHFYKNEVWEFSRNLGCIRWASYEYKGPESLSTWMAKSITTNFRKRDAKPPGPSARPSDKASDKVAY